jgi:hypothetical protein
MSITPRTALPLLAAAQAQKHVTHNEALLQLDALLFARFLDRDLTAPPGTPADGDTYLVHATATGAWTGQNGMIAYASDGAWRFYAPFTGLAAYIVDESKLVVFTGSAWVDYASILSLQNVPLLGVGTTADTTNKLAVKSAALLFDNVGNGVQAKLNKHAAGDTASLLYQTNYSGRAELGLAGDDDFHVKVSPDGAAWSEALKIAAASGVVSLPKGQLAFPTAQNPSTDPNTLDDYEEGTFTPTLIGSTGGTATTSQAQGMYVKVGTLIWFNLRLIASSVAGLTGNVRIGGMPFTAATFFGRNICSTNINNVTGYTTATASAFVPNAMTFVAMADNTGVVMPVSALTATSQFDLNGVYMVAS